MKYLFFRYLPEHISSVRRKRFWSIKIVFRLFSIEKIEIDSNTSFYSRRRNVFWCKMEEIFHSLCHRFFLSFLGAPKYLLFWNTRFFRKHFIVKSEYFRKEILQILNLKLICFIAVKKMLQMSKWQKNVGKKTLQMLNLKLICFIAVNKNVTNE